MFDKNLVRVGYGFFLFSQDCVVVFLCCDPFDLGFVLKDCFNVSVEYVF